MPNPTVAVRKRRVFYIAGFDPRGPGHYHLLYRSEAGRQCSVSGMHISVGARHNEGGSSSSWTVNAREGDVEVETDYTFLRWDDIVRDHWIRTGPGILLATLRTSFGALANGALWQMLKRSWPPAVALLAPLLLVLAMVSVLLAIALAIAQRPGWGTALLLGGVGAGTFIAARHAWRRWHMRWLMASHAFTAGQARTPSPLLNRRLNDWADAIAAAANSSSADEVLVVAHSSGPLLAVSAMARVLPLLDATAAGRPVLSLLTLGQCLPMLSARPEAGWFREEIRQVAGAPQIEWIDFSAPPDSCCFALLDPLDYPLGASQADSPTGSQAEALDQSARPEPGIRSPKLLSPRFAAMFAPKDYKALRADRFTLHFQYIMSAPLLAGYDYFAITGGASTLAARFADKPSVTGFNNLKLFR